MHIAVVGSGYVGLVSGACLADFGHSVICIDADRDKIAALNRDVMPIYEPGLEELVRSNRASRRLAFTTDLKAAVAGADVVFIAVGTPSRRGDGHADLSYVHGVAREMAPHLRDFTVIATKSTVPVGTGDEVERIVRETNPTADVAVVSNPEFLREGSAIGDFKRPDRIVVGLADERARKTMSDVYRPLALNEPPLFFTGRRSAELIKYAANAFLAMKITFINEIADLCESAGADVQDVARGVGLDNRIGRKFLHPGPGYGGSCFPKDTMALVKTAQDHGTPLRLIETTVAVNEQRRRTIARKVTAALGGAVRGRTVAILGLTFKPNTDDMREAPSLDIIRFLQDQGARVRAYDPAGKAAEHGLVDNVEIAGDAYDAAKGADATVIVTEWDEFRALDLERLKKAMAGAVIVDLRNVYRPDDMRRLGFTYVGVGRPASS
jgi:UDPglucose 6-dehydrogenase